jgi:eukaryotic-like serine/threonine-protein kinase
VPGPLRGPQVSLKEQKLPPIATLRAVAALKSPHLAQVRPARIGLGFETVASEQKSLARLEHLLGGPGRLPLPYALRLLLDAMAGLGTLHRALGFVHAEVEPEHVLLGSDGVGRVLPVVRAHWVRGEERAPRRLYYLAPEKLLGDTVDARSDVFSVGVLLWEALAGQRLLEAHEVEQVISRLMGGGVPRARAPEDESWAEPLCGVAERALAVDPARRFATVSEMRDAVEQVGLRYLATSSDMIELFRHPERYARGAAEDSPAPDSQRITLPPHQAPPTIKPRPGSQPPPASVKPVGVGVVDYLDEELTTKPNVAPLPVAARRAHVNTLPGNAPPWSPPEPAKRLERVPPSVPVIITPLPRPPAAALTLASARLRPRSTTPVSFPPPVTAPPPGLRKEPESRQAPSLSPLVAARPLAPSVAIDEPSFELLRPRKRRAALWLVLGAAAAVALFAVRPWLLAPDLTEPRGDASAQPGPGESVGSPAGVREPSVIVSNENKPQPPRPRDVAPRPASTAGARSQARPRSGREEHVVIHDTVDPSIEALRQPPGAATPEVPSVPPPPPAPLAPEPAPAPSKTKPAPASDADRYGI